MIAQSKAKQITASLLCLSALALLLALPAKAQVQNGAVLSGIISEIEISGNRFVEDKEIKDAILSYAGMPVSRAGILEDLKRIYSLGYFQPKSVEARPFKKDDGSIKLEYSIKENKPVTDLTIYGNVEMDSLDAYAIFSPLVGKPENVKLLSAKIQELERSYVDQGFIIARVKDINITESGELKLYIDEGLIDKIVFSGNERTKNSYLKHLLSNSKEGQAYNEKLFNKDYQRLQGTSYFNNISRTIIPSDSGDGYTLEIQLNEKEKYTQIGIGGGVNSGSGIFGNTNISMGNLHGKGESLNINALLGSGFGAGTTFGSNSNLVRRDEVAQASISYNVPFYKDSPYNLNRSIRFIRGPNFNVDLARQNQLTLGTGLSRRVGENHNFRLNASANYMNLDDRDRQTYLEEVSENIIEIDGLSNQEVLTRQGNDFLGGAKGIARAEAKALREEQIVDGFYLGLNPSYVYSNFDNAKRPRDGWRTRIGFNPVWGFDEINSYTKSNLSITKYLPLPYNSTFILNARGGAELAGSLPQFSKYRLGGATGVRGYRQFSDLGLGDRLLIGTGELRTPIYNVLPPLKRYKFLKNVDFAVFADAGLVGGNIRLNRITDRLSQAASVGFGLRVNIPLVGALRVDLGFPLIEALTQDRLFRFNFGPANFF